MNENRSKKVGRWMAAFLMIVGPGTGVAQTAGNSDGSQYKNCFSTSSDPVARAKCLGIDVAGGTLPPQSQKGGGIFCEGGPKAICDVVVLDLKPLGQQTWVIHYVQLQPGILLSKYKRFAPQIDIRSRNIGTDRQKELFTMEPGINSALSKVPFKIFRVVSLGAAGSIGSIYFRYQR